MSMLFSQQQNFFVTMPWDWFFSTLKGLFDPKSFLFVHVGQHQADVGC